MSVRHIAERMTKISNQEHELCWVLSSSQEEA